MKLATVLDGFGRLVALGGSALAGRTIHNIGWNAWEAALWIFVPSIAVCLVFQWLSQSLNAVHNINLCIARIDYRQRFGEELPRD